MQITNLGLRTPFSVTDIIIPASIVFLTLTV